MSGTKRLTFEEKVKRVEEVLERFPNATRKTITDWTGYKGNVLDQMYEAGVKIPKKNPSKSTTTPWMRQLGSLSGRRD